MLPLLFENPQQLLYPSLVAPEFVHFFKMDNLGTALFCVLDWQALEKKLKGHILKITKLFLLLQKGSTKL